MNNFWENSTWELKETSPGNRSLSPSDCNLALLMDIRSELQALNRLLGCPNFMSVPAVLRNIQKNTKRKPRKRKLK